MVGTISGRDDSAAVVRDFHPVRNQKQRERFSFRREKVKWAGRGDPALPSFDVPGQRLRQGLGACGGAFVGEV